MFSDNAHYIVCLRNKRNALKIRALATQTRPCNPRFIVNSYIDATKPKPTVKGIELRDYKTADSCYLCHRSYAVGPPVYMYM